MLELWIIVLGYFEYIETKDRWDIVDLLECTLWFYMSSFWNAMYEKLCIKSLLLLILVSKQMHSMPKRRPNANAMLVNVGI